MEKGTALAERGIPKEGGSILVNGEPEVRRRDRIPTRLLLGERPAAAGADVGWIARFWPKGDRGVSRWRAVIVEV